MTYPGATNTQCRHGRYGHEDCPACDYADDEDGENHDYGMYCECPECMGEGDDS